ncbi:hypothetical protein JZ751_006112 [Albula glossodonta]|uniref:Uncharacterized protein n=1 Tax=Albula glossodonta TaxID=121402 RepID=A0A8T2P3P5_9TELE|nr:hypothetical protein JZ751_006112 [Albula glossodonta]
MYTLQTEAVSAGQQCRFSWRASLEELPQLTAKDARAGVTTREQERDTDRYTCHDRGGTGGHRPETSAGPQHPANKSSSDCRPPTPQHCPGNRGSVAGKQ